MKQLKGSSGREKMIQEQLVERGITDQRVLEAMRLVPRDQFVPRQVKDQAHADKAAPIGHGQTISQPYIVALMTQAMNLKPTHRVLEVGTGSGYQTAILAHLAGEVYTIERVKPLLDEAFERVLSMNLRNVHFRYGDGMQGWPQHAPFDRVLIAAAAPNIPRGLLLGQMKNGGTAVLPIGGEDSQMLVEIKRIGDELKTREICPVRFVKLIGEGAWPQG